MKGRIKEQKIGRTNRKINKMNKIHSKIHSKIVHLNPSVTVITLNVNELSAPIKRQRFSD